MECPFIISIDSNNNSQDILRNYIENFGLLENLKQFSNIEDALEEIKKQEKPPIIILDYDINENYLDLIKIHTNKIIITTSDYNTDIIVKAMRLGAKEILPKPIIKKDLKRVLEFLCLFSDNIDENNSKIISIYSNKGGIGKTTIATNLARELAKTTKEKVALVDLNLQLGDISTFLNLNPKFDVSYVIKNLIEKNEDSVIKAFEKYDNTELYVLSDPCYIEEAESITPYKIDNLLALLKKVFSYIIIDLSSNIDQNTLKVLDKSDMILFTSIVNIPAIRNCQRCLNLFASRRYPKDKIKIIINRYMENDDIKAEDIEIALNEKIYWKIPNNYFSIMEAINKGITVGELNNNSNIANSFMELAGKISDEFVKKTLTKYRGF